MTGEHYEPSVNHPGGPDWCCIRCEDARIARQEQSPFTRAFPLCPTCGNKRCPRTTSHLLDCSGSNEPGQLGSVYQ